MWVIVVGGGLGVEGERCWGSGSRYRDGTVRSRWVGEISPAGDENPIIKGK
jgi:hypothetical protein